MAEVKAFRGLRFRKKAGEIGTLICPPYDIISEEQRQAFIAQNPYNVIRLELPKGEEPYRQAGELLRQWEEEDVLKQDTDEAIYIYEEEFTVYGEKKSFKGMICRVKLEEFSKGVILPHENTLSKAKADRFELMKATACNFSQVYSLYIDPEHLTLGRLDNLSKDTPNVEVFDGEVTHRLWIVNDPVVIKAVASDFAERKLYIADGHHRYETALNYKNYCHENGLCGEKAECDYIMMMLVDMQHEGLVVFPTHRMLHDLPQFDANALIAACEPYFVPEERSLASVQADLNEAYALEKTAFAFYRGGETYTLLTLKDRAVMDGILEDTCPAVRKLDVSVLHALILERCLGIDKENMANQVNLTYTRSASEAVEAVQKGEMQCSFLLNPTRISEILEVASQGGKMPQKSTYFYPKLITGLVMNQMDLKK